MSLEKRYELAGNKPHVSIKNLVAGYGQMQILHDLDLRVGKGQSLCLIGPNGAGKSTILRSEERRVGKEGSNLGSPDDETEKDDRSLTSHCTT